MMLIFQGKKCGHPGGGWSENSDKGGGGVKNGQKFADVLYGWPFSDNKM